MIRSGRMRHRFELRIPKTDVDGDPVRDDYGSPTGETDLVSRPWCNILEVSSQESNSTAINGQEIIVFEVRYSKQFEDPNTKMFIIFEENEYDITSSVNIRKQNEKMHITATKRR